jgi:hypothetical protein
MDMPLVVLAALGYISNFFERVLGISYENLRPGHRASGRAFDDIH